ncbi:hypothetical protein MGYG_00282 [Nannizzia gypsea CBS 118893]|uniref:Uncharacterized protein n=1 Tax=Arthroderma gypseum (strain ATCC MYA-4604 / CBS 118893) TaxID=535722 RepID=E5QYQ2_ARTGP|nr:hypothetical protein MGYG_00282 [Nannizzia gypsea CBS 118893]EFQ97240.1 hypothetical protein MGYG_00282 [Nannizzia gypsea CBS 118893]
MGVVEKYVAGTYGVAALHTDEVGKPWLLGESPNSV